MYHDEMSHKWSYSRYIPRISNFYRFQIMVRFGPLGGFTFMIAHALSRWGSILPVHSNMFIVMYRIQTSAQKAHKLAGAATPARLPHSSCCGT